MKLQSTSIFNFFYKDEPAEIQKRAIEMQNQRYRLGRQQKFNVCTGKRYSKDKKVEQWCFKHRRSTFRLACKNGRQMLHGRSCVRPGSPIRNMPLRSQWDRIKIRGNSVHHRRLNKIQEKSDG